MIGHKTAWFKVFEKLFRIIGVFIRVFDLLELFRKHCKIFSIPARFLRKNFFKKLQWTSNTNFFLHRKMSIKDEGEEGFDFGIILTFYSMFFFTIHIDLESFSLTTLVNKSKTLNWLTASKRLIHLNKSCCSWSLDSTWLNHD